MRLTRNIAGLVGVAAIAFAAGHLDLIPATFAGDTDTDADKTKSELDAYVEANRPGEAHKRLDALTGEWEGEFTIWMEPGEPPLLSTGTVERQWILGGRYLQETIEATSAMGTFTGMGFIGFNNFDGQYEMVWMDDMSTGIYFETGTYDPDKQVLTTRGSHRDPVSGRVITSTGTLDLSRPDEHVYTGYLIGADGRRFKHFKGVTHKRR